MIARKTSARAALLLAALSALPCPRHARAQSSASARETSLGVENEKALQTFKEGIAAFDRRDFEAARVAFLQTFALKPSAPVVRRNLGLAEIYSGHYLEGARRLGRVIHTTDEGTSTDRARMVESLKKAEAHLERVTVEVNMEGAEIQIGDVDLGVSPMPFAWYLEPGPYEVRVSKPGFVTYSESRMARAGNAQHMRIHLKPVAVELPVPVEPPAIAAEPLPLEVHAGPNPWVLAAGGVLTVGGLAAGLTLSLFAADNSDKVERLGDTIGDEGCGADTQYPQQCSDLVDAAAAHDSQVRWATVSFALGAAAGISTIVYGLLASSARANAPPAVGARSVALSLGAQGPMLVVDGAF
jgi:hypothetical protein